MTAYDFRVLRYVHDMSTEEFVNIGVMMWIPQYDQILFRANKNYARISQFFSDFDGKIYRQRIYNLHEAFNKIACDTHRLRPFKNNPEKAPKIFYELVPNDRSCFQWSSIMSGISPIPEGRFEQLFNEYVGGHKTHTPTESDSIWGVVRGALEKHDLLRRVQLNFAMQAANVDWPFSMSWNNGIRQVLEPIPLAFQNPKTIIDRANIWNGRLSLLAKENKFQCTAVISNAPTGPTTATEAYYQASKILENVDSMRKVITTEEVYEYMPEIRKDLSIKNR